MKNVGKTLKTSILIAIVLTGMQISANEISTQIFKINIKLSSSKIKSESLYIFEKENYNIIINSDTKEFTKFINN